MKNLKNYFIKEIEGIFRPAKGILPHPYFVPGGIFHDELWDWDSFWIAKGLFALLDDVSLAQRDLYLSHARGSWMNFFEVQAADGTVPIMAKSDSADFFGCSSSGVEKNQAKPVFGQFAFEIAQRTDDFKWIAPYFDRLCKFYDKWSTKYGTATGLLVWGSDVAVGVDNDPTVFGRPEFSSASLLLNCLFYADLLATIEIAGQIGRPKEAAKYQAIADRVGKAVIEECWDPADEFFYTVDVQVGDHRDKYLPGLKQGMGMSWRTMPLKIATFGGFLPLWCGMATEEQARVVVEKHLRNEGFNARYGIRSLSKRERMYEPGTNSANPSNWLGPIWIIANYMVYAGLKRYGFQADAEELAAKTRALLEEDLQATGTLHECYHPDTGAPNFNAGLLSWNVLVLLMAPKNA